MGEFSPPFFSKPPSFFCFSYPSNIEIIFDISDIITKIHPPFQNPGSALAISVIKGRQLIRVMNTDKCTLTRVKDTRSHNFVLKQSL